MNVSSNTIRLKSFWRETLTRAAYFWFQCQYIDYSVKLHVKLKLQNFIPLCEKTLIQDLLYFALQRFAAMLYYVTLCIVLNGQKFLTGCVY